MHSDSVQSGDADTNKSRDSTGHVILYDGHWYTGLVRRPSTYLRDADPPSTTEFGRNFKLEFGRILALLT